MHLGGDKVIVLVRKAVPARLRMLVQILLDIDEELRVYTRAADIMDAPPGSLLLLAPRSHEAGWLNLHRPLFVERRWRVVLWADDALVLALKEKAPDFFDWISHVVSCPEEAGEQVPSFAAVGLRSAPGYPGVVWHEGDLDAALAVTFSPGAVVRASARGAYADLVDAVAQAAIEGDQGWLVWSGAEDARDVVRVRWAMAEAGWRGRSILENPRCAAPGWWPAGAACMDAHDAAARLRAQTGERAALFAALLDLEPGAIALAERLPPDALTRLVPDLRRMGDPGAMLAREALARGSIDVDEVVGWRARGLPGGALAPEAWMGAPVLRALYREPAVTARCEQVRARTAGWLAVFAGDEENRLAPEEAPTDEDMVLWADGCPTPPALPNDWPARVPMSYWMEAVLRAESVHVWSDIARWGMALGHMDAVEMWLSRHGVAPSESSDLRAGILELRGRYEEAEAIYRDSVRRLQGIVQKREHPLVANWLIRLAYILAREGRFEEAEATAREALHIFERTDRMRGDLDVGLARFCLAFVLARQGHYAAAEAEYRKSLLIDERSYGTREHPSVAAVLVNLAGLLAEQGRYTEAEATIREAEGIFQRIHQKREHRDVATSLEVLAGVLVRQGRYEEAIVAYQESIEILERVLGTRQHLAVIGALHRLARALKGWGRYAEAESVLREAMASSEAILGAQRTVHTIPLSCSLAGVLLVQERTGEALVLAREAWEAALVGEHTVLAIEAGRILFDALTRVEQAEQAREVERRIEALLQSLSPMHPLRQAAEPG